MFKIGKKLKNDHGITWVVAILAILVVVAAVLIIVVPGVFNHVTDTKLTYDTKSVATAKDVALIQYLTDAPNGLVTYYYDEISHNALPREKIGTIKGYGRCSREENLNEETGAAGIPSLPEQDGGPQLLALTVKPDGIYHIRWTGHEWTYWDYVYMLREERDLLTPADLREMDVSSEKTARRRARARYESDFKDQLDRKEDPGTVVYNYDQIDDTLYLDESSKDRLPDQADNVLACSDIQGYSLSDRHPAGSVIQVTIGLNEIKTDWQQGKVGK